MWLHDEDGELALLSLYDFGFRSRLFSFFKPVEADARALENLLLACRSGFKYSLRCWDLLIIKVADVVIFGPIHARARCVRVIDTRRCI